MTHLTNFVEFENLSRTVHDMSRRYRLLVAFLVGLGLALWPGWVQSATDSNKPTPAQPGRLGRWWKRIRG